MLCECLVASLVVGGGACCPARGCAWWQPACLVPVGAEEAAPGCLEAPEGCSLPPPLNPPSGLGAYALVQWGILRTSEFEGAVRWDERSQRAALGDVLRVHDWPYVRKMQVW